MTTHLIGQTILQLVHRRDLRGRITLWMEDYELTLGYDLAEEEIWIERVRRGMFLSNDLTPARLPEEIDLEFFLSTMGPILELRHEEVLVKNERIDREEQEEKEKAEAEQEARDWENHKEHLNLTYGDY